MGLFDIPTQAYRVVDDNGNKPGSLSSGIAVPFGALQVVGVETFNKQIQLKVRRPSSAGGLNPLATPIMFNGPILGRNYGDGFISGAMPCICDVTAGVPGVGSRVDVTSGAWTVKITPSGRFIWLGQIDNLSPTRKGLVILGGGVGGAETFEVVQFVKVGGSPGDNIQQCSYSYDIKTIPLTSSEPVVTYFTNVSYQTLGSLSTWPDPWWIYKRTEIGRYVPATFGLIQRRPNPNSSGYPNPRTAIIYINEVFDATVECAGTPPPSGGGGGGVIA